MKKRRGAEPILEQIRENSSIPGNAKEHEQVHLAALKSAPHKPPSGHLCPLSPVPTLELVSGTSRFVFRLTSYNFIQYKQ